MGWTFLWTAKWQNTAKIASVRVGLRSSDYSCWVCRGLGASRVSIICLIHQFDNYLKKKKVTHTLKKKLQSYFIFVTRVIYPIRFTRCCFEDFDRGYWGSLFLLFLYCFVCLGSFLFLRKKKSCNLDPVRGDWLELKGSNRYSN